MTITTRRIPGSEYERELLVDGVVRLTIERASIPTNAHFNIWRVVGEKHHYPTLRDLKADVARLLVALDAPTP